jgi:predicted nuclease of predicted toxin-antitoxin system
MKIKIDEDLPKAVAEMVRKHILDTATVVEERLSGTLDPDLWKTIQEENRFLITGDKGFANIRHYPPGTHSGVLLLRPEEEGIPQLKLLMDEVLNLGILQNLSGCIAVATPGRLRIRRPKTTEDQSSTSQEGHDELSSR